MARSGKPVGETTWRWNRDVKLISRISLAQGNRQALAHKSDKGGKVQVLPQLLGLRDQEVLGSLETGSPVQCGAGCNLDYSVA